MPHLLLPVNVMSRCQMHISVAPVSAQSNGSARVLIGGTEVLASVKVFVLFTAEMDPAGLCSHHMTSHDVTSPPYILFLGHGLSRHATIEEVTCTRTIKLPTEP